MEFLATNFVPVMFVGLLVFLLMGFLCFYSRFGEDLYLTARNWCGHFRGGLAIASEKTPAGRIYRIVQG